ncbi:MAG: homocysteine S-methyltransferase family protein [Chthoniobacteraceae bacterium]|nr:homocysteine S-methyltransferase family protein [Chthoniobacteraceae bacterium]
MNDLLTVLATRPLLCDGAMGTQLLAKGLTSGECGMLWNTGRPEAVRGVHDAYRRSGCNLLTTNTFGGTLSALERHGLAARMAELNRAGARLAREAAGDTGWVLGDIGPFGDFLEPLGDMTADELRAIFRAQAQALIEGGADALLVETMSDPAEAETAIAAAKDCGDFAVVATYAFQKTGDAEFRTMMGTGVGEAVERAIAAGADLVGANCGTALSFPDYLELARQLVRAAGKTPVILQPNAGAPQVIGGETVYLATPAEMAAIVAPLVDIGVRVVGGCCGTSPAHLAAMGHAVSTL